MGALVAFGVGSAVAGCALLGSGGSVSELDENPMPEREPVFQEPTDEQIRDALGDDEWSCYYDPSINNDWHDDVVCRNSFESFRPILLPELGFVTESEMIAAGEAYEVELNR